MNLKNTVFTAKYLRIALVALILAFSFGKRLVLISEAGQDVKDYRLAVEDALSGINPYQRTLQTYSTEDTGGHTFAYLPGLIYINAPLYILALIIKINFVTLWKIPILLADFGVGILLIKLLYRKNYPALLAGLLLWYINPYFYMKNSYVSFDPIPIFLMFLSLYYLKKDSVSAGALYALSIAVKTFPIILLPVFLLKTKNRQKLIAAGAIVALAVTLPFITDLQTFIKGSIFVHGDRPLQGRPFLFYISYFYNIELFQIIPLKFYSYAAIAGAWIITTVLYLTKIAKNKYSLSLIAFANFYLFTPVLNRTYLLWFIPVLIMAAYEFFYERHPKLKAGYYIVLIAFWGFYYWYLSVWKDGFHIWRP